MFGGLIRPNKVTPHGCFTVFRVTHWSTIHEWLNGPAMQEWLNGPTMQEWQNCPTMQEWLNHQTMQEWLNHPTMPEWLNCPTMQEWLIGPTFQECIKYSGHFLQESLSGFFLQKIKLLCDILLQCKVFLFYGDYYTTHSTQSLRGW